MYGKCQIRVVDLFSAREAVARKRLRIVLPSGSNCIMWQKRYHSVSATPKIWKRPTDLLARFDKRWSRAWSPLQITHLNIPNVKCKEKIFR